MRRLFKLTFSIITIILLTVAFLLTPACSTESGSVGWQTLYKDNEWLRGVQQYISLSYAEEDNRAAFTMFTREELEPDLYTTLGTIRVMNILDESIKNPDLVIEYIKSNQDERGAYYDKSWRPLTQTGIALETLRELGITPENIDLTVQYLLSNKYTDGTFLWDSEKGVTGSENTRLRRISEGTGEVIDSLISLGLKDKIPSDTIEVIKNETEAYLSDNGDQPDLSDTDFWQVISAIKSLSEINPNLVSAQARNYIVYALRGLPELPENTFLFPSRANSLLDMAELLDLPEARNTDLLNKLGDYLQEKIFPLQNIFGGFGNPKVTELATTAENLILAKRLGVTYPNLDRLKADIDKYRMDNGWTNHYEIEITTTSNIFTYYALDIARFSGNNGFDRQKIKNYLRESFSNQGSESVNLQELYYAVKALKLLGADPDSADLKLVENKMLELCRELPDKNESDYGTMFTYAARLSQETGLKLPETAKADIARLAGYYKKDLLSGKKYLLPASLYNLWAAARVSDPAILTAEEAKQHLQSLYDQDAGGYYAMLIANTPSSLKVGEKWTPEYAPRAEVYQTYNAWLLLQDIHEKLPDQEKTIGFVTDCKCKFGFSRLPGKDVSLEATYAAIKLMESTK